MDTDVRNHVPTLLQFAITSGLATAIISHSAFHNQGRFSVSIAAFVVCAVRNCCFGNFCKFHCFYQLQRALVGKTLSMSKGFNPEVVYDDFLLQIEFKFLFQFFKIPRNC